MTHTHTRFEERHASLLTLLLVVLFSCCPELFPLLLFCPPLDDETVIVVSNVRRWIASRGYGATFEFVALLAEPAITEVLIMDASQTLHFARR